MDFLAAASALTWLGVRLFGVRLGPTDWLDAVDLRVIFIKKCLILPKDWRPIWSRFQPVVVVDSGVAGHASGSLHPVWFWSSWSR